MTNDPMVLLHWMKILNPGLNTEYWKVLDRYSDSWGQRLILLVDQESAKVIKEAKMAAYTGMDSGQFKILSDPFKHEETQEAESGEASGGAEATIEEAMERQDAKTK